MKPKITLETLTHDPRILPEEAMFLTKTLAPHLNALPAKDQELVLTRYKCILDSRSTHSRSFPEGEYTRVPIGVDGLLRTTPTPEELTYILTRGVLTRKDEHLAKALAFFDPAYVHSARENVNGPALFKQVREQLQAGAHHLTTEGAKHLLSELAAKVNNTRVTPIISFLHKSLADKRSYNNTAQLVARVNAPRIDYTQDMGRMGCCAFWGILEGAHGSLGIGYQKDLQSRYHASNLFMVDPELGLLQLQIEENATLERPVGMLLLADLIGQQKGARKEKYLLVDSVEAYRPKGDHRFAQADMPLRSMSANTWRRTFKEGLIGLAARVNPDHIFYNTSFWNEGGNEFTKYLLDSLSDEGYAIALRQEVTFWKKRGTSCIPREFNYAFGYFLDSFMPPYDKRFFYGSDPCHAMVGIKDIQGLTSQRGAIISRPAEGWH